MGGKLCKPKASSSADDTATAAAAPISEVAGAAAAIPEVGATATGWYQIEFIDKHSD